MAAAVLRRFSGSTPARASPTRTRVPRRGRHGLLLRSSTTAARSPRNSRCWSAASASSCFASRWTATSAWRARALAGRSRLIDTTPPVAHAIAASTELSPAVLAALDEQLPGARPAGTSPLGRASGSAGSRARSRCCARPMASPTRRRSRRCTRPAHRRGRASASGCASCPKAPPLYRSPCRTFRTIEWGLGPSTAGLRAPSMRT